MDSKQERTVMIIIILFTVLVFGSIFLFKYIQDKRFEQFVYDYNGFQIRKEGLTYKTRIFLNENQYPVYIGLRNDPRNVENISLEDGYQKLLNKKQVYVTIDAQTNLSGKTTLAALEIDEIIDNPFLYNIPVNSAFTTQFSGDIMMTCKDVNSTNGVIWLKLDEITEIVNDDGCIIIKAIDEDDMIRAADRLVYSLLGVIRK